MRTVLVNENHEKTGVEWSVSFDGYNTGVESQTVLVADGKEAFKLKSIVDDLKEKIGFLCYQLKPEFEEKRENGQSGFDLLIEIIEDIESTYL